MKVLVSGTRNGVDNLIVETMLLFVAKLNTEEKILLHGTAKGVDTQAANYAKKLGWEVKPFKPDWSIGNHAGLNRNSDMVNYGPDFGIFIPGPTSTGTYDCLQKYKLLHKPYILYDFNKRTFTYYEV